MLALGLGQLAEVRPSYRHMMMADAELWTEFLRQKPVEISRVWYDVHVGKELDVGASASELVRRVSRGVTRKRIDVVALVGGVYWIIEVKPFGGYVALGQVVTYRRLFIETFGAPEGALGVVVCEEMDGDCRRDFEAEAIRVYEVSP